MEEKFEEHLNTLYPEFVMGGLKFKPADILKKCDPIAYEIGLNDYEGRNQNNE